MQPKSSDLTIVDKLADVDVKVRRHRRRCRLIDQQLPYAINVLRPTVAGCQRVTKLNLEDSTFIARCHGVQA
jgi:hypothetical protein